MWSRLPAFAGSLTIAARLKSGEEKQLNPTNVYLG